MTYTTQTIRDAIIVSALPHVPFDGWSEAALAQAARNAGYDPGMARAVFPGGVAEALDHFSDWADRRMLERLAGTDPGSLRVRDRVRAAVEARLEILRPHREAVRRALVWRAVPPRGAGAARAVWRTADRIWNWAGDTATDYNRYTKRGLLCGILASATLYWLNDETPDMQATRTYVDRRIETVLKLGKVIGKIKQGNPLNRVRRQ